MDHPARTIRFTTTEDGVDIAFWEIGEGTPLVILNNLSISHAELEWTIPSIAALYIELAKRYRLIRYDPRGHGLSGDPPGEWGAATPSGAQQGMTSQEMGLDLAAVANALDLDGFALMGVSVQAPVAIEYAATHPEVTELILCSGFSAVATSHIAPWLEAQSGLEHLGKGGGPSFSVWERIIPREEQNAFRAMQTVNDRGRSSASTVASQFEWDADRFLADISIPTLIISPRHEDFDMRNVDALGDGRRLASAIENSELQVIHGLNVPYWSDRAATLAAIDSFLQPQFVSPTPSESPPSFRTIVFTDIVESTEYVRRVGDAEGRAAIRELEQQVAALAGDHGGRVVKNLGDGSLVSFGSNSSAITFALNLQDACSDGPLGLRVGMDAGEPIQEDGDIHGTVVAHASRIGDLGDAGEIIVSDSVRRLAAGKGFSFEPRGEVLLKGFDEPERVWEVIDTRHA